MSKDAAWQLTDLTGLRRLILAAALTPEQAWLLGKLENLRQLALSAPDLTEHAIQQLHRIPALEELRLFSRHVSERSIRIFAEFPALRRLHLHDSSLDHGGLERMREALSGVRITHAPRRLDPPGGRLNGDLSYRPKLKEGTAHWEPLAASRGALLLPMDREYAFHTEELAADDLSALSEVRGLELVELSITSSRIPAANARRLAAFNNLMTLEMSYCEVESAVYEALVKLPKLAWLVLDFSNAGDYQMQWIGRLPAIRSLSLRGLKLTDESLHTLSRIRSLQELNVSWTGVTATGIQRFQDVRPAVKLTHSLSADAPLEETIAHGPARTP